MGIAVVLLLVSSAAPRDAVYPGAVTLGGQVVPLFANGHLVYLQHPNDLQVFGPETQLAYGYEVPCPAQASTCSVAAVAIARDGTGALGMGFLTSNGHAGGIRLLDKAGKERKFAPTGRYVPIQLAYDKNGDLWALGWERDRYQNHLPSSEDYPVLRKFSRDGAPLGAFLPKSLWSMRHGPHLGGGGYWTMYAAEDRVGAVLNESFSGRTPEWIEWDSNGALLSRTPLTSMPRNGGRAFSGKGKLYAQFRLSGERPPELRVLDTRSGDWTPVRSNLPDGLSAFLLGADGDHLVYRVNRSGNVHLVWAKPD